MPLEYRIDQERRLIVATATGVLQDEELFAYQRGVWARPELAGFDEVFDLGGIEELVLASSDRARALADLASTMDVAGSPSRLAIVAPQDYAYGLARMYATYRTLHPRGEKAVQVFRSMEAALDWLRTAESGPASGGSPSGMSAGR
jgi:hypothetical protein